MLSKLSATIIAEGNCCCCFAVKAHLHKDEISNETSNDESAQRLTRRRSIHTTLPAGRKVDESSPPIRVCVAFSANLIPIEYMVISMKVIDDIQHSTIINNKSPSNSHCIN